MGGWGDAQAVGVVAFFRQVAKAYVGDAVIVDRVPFAGAKLRGVVGWTGKVWRIVVADCYTDKDLLWVLAHELGHIVQGDVTKATVTDFRQDLDYMAGRPTVEAAAAAKRWGRGQPRSREDRASAWADTFVARWWPGCRVALDTVAKARGM